jgi:hypothetical protein
MYCYYVSLKEDFSWALWAILPTYENGLSLFFSGLNISMRRVELNKSRDMIWHQSPEFAVKHLETLPLPLEPSLIIVHL